MAAIQGLSERIAYWNAIDQIKAQCSPPDSDAWGDCAQHPRSDWMLDVLNGDTLSGYWEWVLSRAESEDMDLRLLSAG